MWGDGNDVLLMMAKRLFLLLPALAIILSCWVTIGSLLTVPVRQKRREFVTAIFMTWWDMGKSILLFWGGIMKLGLRVLAAVLGAARFSVFAVWAIVQDILLIPFGFLRDGARVVMSSPVPWLAVTLTLSWCVIETTIFTYVTSPLVIDTFSNITGEQLSANSIRIPLALFLFCVVLGSYAVLSTFVDSMKKKKISSIIGIGVIEMVVLLVEVVFLYREFVDSLVPWFAQYSDSFDLGVFQTLAISCFVWFGVRSLSWFLFASHGTPTVMAVIQGKNLKMSSRSSAAPGHFFSLSTGFMARIKSETEWAKTTGSELVDALMLPPLQVLAACINFCTLLLLSDHLFALPFEDMKEVKYTDKLQGTISRLDGRKQNKNKNAAPAEPREQSPRPAADAPADFCMKSAPASSCEPLSRPANASNDEGHSSDTRQTVPVSGEQDEL